MSCEENFKFDKIREMNFKIVETSWDPTPEPLKIKVFKSD